MSGSSRQCLFQKRVIQAKRCGPSDGDCVIEVAPSLTMTSRSRFQNRHRHPEPVTNESDVSPVRCHLECVAIAVPTMRVLEILDHCSVYLPTPRPLRNTPNDTLISMIITVGWRAGVEKLSADEHSEQGTEYEDAGPSKNFAGEQTRPSRHRLEKPSIPGRTAS